MIDRALLLIGALAVTLGPLASHADEPVPFITHRDGKLYEGDQEFRFVSWNIPNLHNVEDAFEFFGTSPWRWPDAFEIADALETVHQMGGRVARTYVLSVRREGSDMGDNVHVIAPGEFNEEAFETLDLVLKIAAEKGVRVLIPLVDNWHWWGGAREYEAFRGKPKGSFWSDAEVIADFKQTIDHVVRRRNTLTGVRYCDDPTILGWETGNEVDATPEWTREIAAYLKQLDPNHLVVDGCSLHGIPTESLGDPHVDVVTTHHYPNTGNNNAEAVVAAIKTVGRKKAYFVGEFGFLPVDEAQRVFGTVVDGGASGALFWSLRFHRREGGFYWHHEASGGDVFKAYHWPTFPSGEEYREHLVMPMIREAAYRIRGLETPPMPVPATPTMLRPESPRLLSWQGSAGATGYDIQRASDASGPWTTIAEGVSDAAVQYRPLYADESAQPGTASYYRVIAKSETGTSPPSAAVGPIVANERLLVDEMAEPSRAASISGEVRFVTNEARKVQEDIHRLAMPAVSAVTYRIAGACRRVSVWVFAGSDPSLTIETSSDGGTFVAADSNIDSPSLGANDYGYLRPFLFTAKVTEADQGWIRLRTTAETPNDVQVSRVEIRHE